MSSLRDIFCWVCFSSCTNNDACHTHVRQHHGGNVFVSPTRIGQQHEKIRQARFSQLMQSVDSSYVPILMQHPQVKEFIVKQVKMRALVVFLGFGFIVGVLIVF